MQAIFEHLQKTRGTSWYPQPASIRSYPVEPLTGNLVAADHHGASWEKCLRAPDPALPSDYDAQGRVMLPAVFADWLASPANTLGTLVSSSSSSSKTTAPLEILEPPAGSVFYLDPDIPAANQSIALRAASSATLTWSSPTLSIAATRARLAEGRHTLTARDPLSGAEAKTWIEVKAW